MSSIVLYTLRLIFVACTFLRPTLSCQFWVTGLVNKLLSFLLIVCWLWMYFFSRYLCCYLPQFLVVKTTEKKNFFLQRNSFLLFCLLLTTPLFLRCWELIFLQWKWYFSFDKCVEQFDSTFEINKGPFK